MTLVITLASRNAGKLFELNHWIQASGAPVELVLNPDAPDIDETGADFIDNATLKARLTPPAEGSVLVLGEDSGMAVEALDGSFELSPFPGLKSNRWMTPAIRETLLGIEPDRGAVSNEDLCLGILQLMHGVENRRADYRCGMALWHADKGLLFTALEKTDLHVIDTMRGTGGFGYDPIVMPVDADGILTGRTMAELTTAEKNAISHRGKAFRRLLQYVSTLATGTGSTS